MKITKEQIITIILIIFYVALFIWPAYLFFFYLRTVGMMKPVGLLIAIIIELCIGAFLCIRQFKRQKEIKKTGSKVGFGVLAGTYLIYVISVIWFFIRVLINVLS
jgi:uncharacterized membrane protein